MEEKQRYLRWLGILCVIMAAFCLGVLSSNPSRYHRSPGLVPAISKGRYRE